MTLEQDNHSLIRLAVDAMGADEGPKAVILGAAIAIKKGLKAKFLFFGDENVLQPLLSREACLAHCEIRHAPDTVSMEDKPGHVLRRGRETSMWLAIQAVKSGEAVALVSGGNTGALMALSRHQLRMINGVDRPAITALWPTTTGRSVVLDVGANIEANALQLVQFSVMGEVFYRALTGASNPSVGLLNVGAEELKGHDILREAATSLRTHVDDMAFYGFVEGNDISKGTVDVVVTDGFTGNVALKSAEGAARLVGGWTRDAVKGSFLSKIASLLMYPQLKKLQQRVDPSSVNGGVFLGLKNVVVKSHGGADAAGIASALTIAQNLAGHSFIADMGARVDEVMERIKTAELAQQDQPLSKSEETKSVHDIVKKKEAETIMETANADKSSAISKPNNTNKRVSA